MRYVEFEAQLDQDLSWRKLEISDLFLLALENNKEVVLKSLILLLYAHWEGYIKRSSKLYLKYISDKNIYLEDLSLNFKAIFLKDQISSCIEKSVDFTLENELRFIKMYDRKKQKFNVKIALDDDLDTTFIDTKSNLKEEIYRRILKILGLEYKSCLQTKKNYIDQFLLANRNCIGHGSILNLNEQVDFNLSIYDLDKLKSIMIKIMDSFRDELLDYASMELYLEVNSEKRSQYEKRREEYLQKEFSDIEAKFLRP